MLSYYNMLVGVEHGSELEAAMLKLLRQQLDDEAWGRRVRQLKRHIDVGGLSIAVALFNWRAKLWSNQLNIKSIADLHGWGVAALEKRGAPNSVITHFAAELEAWGLKQAD